MKKAPIPKKIKKVFSAHNDIREDNYYWMRDDKRENKEVLDHLNEENKYTKSWFKKNKVSNRIIFDYYKKSIPKFEESFKTKIDEYNYFSTTSLSQNYRKYYRERGKNKKLLLDVNKLAKNKNYFSISGIYPSRNHQLIAYGQDTKGRREYSIVIKNVENNKIIEKNICSSSGKIIWNNDSSGYFYLKKDSKTLIADSLFFHKLNTNNKEDSLIYKENDKQFNLNLSLSRTKKRLFLEISKTESNEFRTLDLHDDDYKLKVFLKRRNNHLYYLDDSPNEYFILSNRNKKINFALYKTEIENTKENNWKVFIRHNKKELLENFQIYENFLVLETRKNGLPQLLLIDKKNRKKSYICFKNSSYSAYLSSCLEYKSNKFNFVYSSLDTPSSIYSLNFITRKRKKLWEEKFNYFKNSKYVTERILIKARDGKKIPVSLIYKKGINLKSSPLLMYGYGAYGLIIEPSFRLTFLPLIDDDFIFAIAHIRGGQDMGRDWYDQGRMLNKLNTFYDFIDSTKGLLNKNLGNPGKVFAMGGSAGGLLMGAIINFEPKLYKGIVSAVPFVDVLTTMSDESIPLTTFEYKEWGNPSKKKEYFYIKRYSPYDNIDVKPYPSVLVTSSLYDSQVQYYEPAKYVPKLREYSSSGNPVLLKMNMIGGHAGKSGRLESLKETSEELSFLQALAKRDF